MPAGCASDAALGVRFDGNPGDAHWRVVAALGITQIVSWGSVYEPAFVVIAHAFRANCRRALTVLTLFGGFASTVFWPLANYRVTSRPRRNPGG